MTLQTWKAAESEAYEAKSKAIESVIDSLDSILELLDEDTQSQARKLRARLTSAERDYEQQARASQPS
jgi:hypothetical protein